MPTLTDLRSLEFVQPTKMPGLDELRLRSRARRSRRWSAAGLGALATLAAVTAAIVLTSNPSKVNPSTKTGSQTSSQGQANGVYVAYTVNMNSAWISNPGAGFIMSVNLATGQAGTQIAMPQIPGPIAISPDGSTAYVGGRFTDTLTPVNLADNSVLPTINLNEPQSVDQIAITPDGRFAYVVDGGVSESITPVNLVTLAVGTPINVGPLPVGITLTPDGRFALVAIDGGSANTVAEVNLSSNTVEKTFVVGRDPYSIAVTPDGSRAYVTNAGSDSVTPINLTSGQVGAPIAVGRTPEGIAITRDGQSAFVVNAGANYPGPNTVSRLDLSSNTVTSAVTVAPFSSTITIPRDGTTAYVIGGTGTLTPINTLGNTVGQSVSFGSPADGVAGG
jgi:YVTN family beta-propeller protein